MTVSAPYSPNRRLGLEGLPSAERGETLCFGSATSSRITSITRDMHLNITARFTSTWQSTPSLSNKCTGKRLSNARPIPAATLPQCSVRHAASSSSCESTESRCALSRPTEPKGLGIAPPAFAAMALARWRLPMMLPRLRPMDSRKTCMPTTMPVSRAKTPAHHAQPPIAQTKAKRRNGMELNAWRAGPGSRSGPRLGPETSAGLGPAGAASGGLGSGAGGLATVRSRCAVVLDRDGDGFGGGTTVASRCESITPTMFCNSSAIRPNEIRILKRSSRPTVKAPVKLFPPVAMPPARP
mmetsp:Transcript_1949/g.5422  ORF Transcript_1949/g.5422 Transcript_1949/m.5422 type:complete len:297 (-) Transcript_1949:118-1008(-)